MVGGEKWLFYVVFLGELWGGNLEGLCDYEGLFPHSYCDWLLQVLVNIGESFEELHFNRKISGNNAEMLWWFGELSLWNIENKQS